MQKNGSMLTVYFEDPFWVGVWERWDDKGLTAAKITFGGEPRDAEIYGFLLSHWHELRFSPAVEGARKRDPENPKRRQREIRRQLEGRGTGTKSQQALQLQREAGQVQRKKEARAAEEEKRERQYAQRREKRKEKRRGR